MVPSGWRRIALHSFMDFKNGVNADKEAYGKGVKFVNIMDIFNNTDFVSADIIGSVSISQKQLETYSVIKGDVLFNRTSEIPEEIAFSSVYCGDETITFGGFVIRGRQRRSLLETDYAKYCFQEKTVRREMIRRCQGGIRANIGQKDLGKVIILLPPLPEQKKIARILSTWDRAIETVDKLIENSKQQKKALMQQLLTGKKRLPGFSGEWKKVRLGEVCDIQGGKRLPKGKQLVANNTGHPYLRVADMYMGGISLDDIHYVPSDVAPSISRYIVKEGDIFITVAGTLGLVGIVPPDLDGANLTENADKLTNFKANRLFLLEVLQSPLIQRHIDAEKTTNAQPKLALTRIREFRINLPELEEQKAIALVAQCLNQTIQNYTEQHKQLSQQKQALMQQLLTGKRRVQVS